jgi:hypothetical protein
LLLLLLLLLLLFEGVVGGEDMVGMSVGK